ncbi:hypothetical protein H4582DRAFT_2127410 [Lactarius indigo]|nr:hypothetical protein H4582DRAFT_2127410 [Lactarius indigo]
MLSRRREKADSEMTPRPPRQPPLLDVALDIITFGAGARLMPLTASHMAGQTIFTVYKAEVGSTRGHGDQIFAEQFERPSDRGGVFQSGINVITLCFTARALPDAEFFRNPHMLDRDPAAPLNTVKWMSISATRWNSAMLRWRPSIAHRVPTHNNTRSWVCAAPQRRQTDGPPIISPQRRGTCRPSLSSVVNMFLPGPIYWGIMDRAKAKL